MRMKIKVGVIWSFFAIVLMGCKPSAKEIELLPYNVVIEDDGVRSAQFELAKKKIGLLAIYHKTNLEAGSKDLTLADSTATEILYQSYLSRLKHSEVDTLQKLRLKFMNKIDQEFQNKKSLESTHQEQ